MPFYRGRDAACIRIDRRSGVSQNIIIFWIDCNRCKRSVSLFHHPLIFFFIYLITCIGSGAFHPTAVAITGSLTQHRKGLFVTIFASGGALGLALSHIIFTGWHKHLDFSTFWLMIPAVLLVLFTSLFSIPGASHQPAQSGRRYGLTELKRLFHCRELKILYFSQVCIQSIYWGTIFLLPDVLQSKGYPEWICFGCGHFAFIIGGALMMVPGGYLSDRFSARSVLLISNSLGSVIFYLFLISSQLPIFGVLLMLMIMGASLGIASPVAIALGNRIMPSRPGLVSAFLMGMVWCVAEWLGPGGGGMLTKVFSNNGPVMSLSILGVLFFGGTLLTALLPIGIEREFELDAT